MIDIGTALTWIGQHARTMPVERVSLSHAEGRVLAETVRSASNLPPFDNAAMDGYALAWTKAVGPGYTIEIVGEQAAGDGLLTSGPGAISIMTGARVPDELDTVIPVEDVAVLSNADDGRPLMIRIERNVACGQHVRCAGEDIGRNEEAVLAGTRLGSAECMLMRGVGIGEVSVRRRPRVVLICTGHELVDEAAAPLSSGQIYNTNGPYLESRLRQAGANVIAKTTIADSAAALVATVREWLHDAPDIVISTGAVSMGRYDFVPDALAELGGEIIFHKVKMRPGKPLLFATLPGGVLFFGLPGNPVSSAVGLRFFVESALRHMLAMTPEQPWRLPLADAVAKKASFHLYQKAELQVDAGGTLRVGLLKGQESFKIRPLLRASVWAGLPADADHMDAGALVDVHALCHFDNTLFART